jgi:hypothetical protein
MHFLCQPFAFASPCHAVQDEGQMPTHKDQASKAHPQPQLSANHMIGMDFAFTHYSPHAAAAMASG